MRFYMKLAAMALLAFAGQALVSTGAMGEAYFAMRCYVAHTAGDASLEHRLICECEEKLAADNASIVAIAYGAARSEL